MIAEPNVAGLGPEGSHRFFRRHDVPNRISRRIDARCLAFLPMGVAQIFNAHPTFYWGGARTSTASRFRSHGCSRRCRCERRSHAAKPKTKARYVVFHCADNMAREGGAVQFYYASLDPRPQTLLAYEINGQALPIEHGVPVRPHAERELGHKMAKFLNRIEIVESYAQVNGGRGGYWEGQSYSRYRLLGGSERTPPAPLSAAVPDPIFDTVLKVND
jgi:hypothetical protein